MKLKSEDLRNMTEDELLNKLSSLEAELLKLNYERRSGRLEKPHLFKETKKNIARILTILKEKEKK